jgi:flagellar biosynthetic protein FliP
LCLFLTVSVMAPVWQQSWDEGVVPYIEAEGESSRPTIEESATATVRPVREFMSRQIHAAGNTDGVFLLLDYQRPVEDSPRAEEWVEPTTFAEVPLSVLLPSYLLSELKTAFAIGFLVFLPFVVIDLVVSSLLVSTGVMMLPPVMVSLPLKLLLFVMIDGWFLTAGMLLQSVQVTG